MMQPAPIDRSSSASSTMPNVQRNSWSHAAAIYSAFQLCFSIIHLRSTSQPDVRALLQLISALALLPSIAATRASPSIYGTGRLRWPILSAFLISLTQLINAALRMLAAIHAMLYHHNSPPSANVTTPFIAHVAVQLIAVLVFRRAGPVSGFDNSPILARIVSYPHYKHGNRAPCNSAPALLAILIHAVVALSLHAADAIAMLSQKVLVMPVLDVAAVLFAVSLAYPLLVFSVRILMQATPQNLLSVVQAKRSIVMALDGVLSVSNVHVWEETAGVCIGTLSVTVKNSANAASVLDATLAAFEGIVDDLTVQVDTWQGSLPIVHSSSRESCDVERVAGDV